ncbi:hypothetical protein Acr_29g0002630 [Actinidia rufa]|uniref:Uncharacterized protein n=1 Tax=Actinidia rufa TaxID=165716 RepID=A0A7J0HDQ7_9ERIC|nr:hypothetical protein Acr_29g0002630 [Actinidia rufa]
MYKFILNDVLREVSPALTFLRKLKHFYLQIHLRLVTLILEDDVPAPSGLAKVFDAAVLTKYLFPLSKMPRYGEDWPSVKDIVANDERLIVFTARKMVNESLTNGTS